MAIHRLLDRIKLQPINQLILPIVLPPFSLLRFSRVALVQVLMQCLPLFCLVLSLDGLTCVAYNVLVCGVWSSVLWLYCIHCYLTSNCICIPVLVVCVCCVYRIGTGFHRIILMQCVKEGILCTGQYSVIDSIGASEKKMVRVIVPFGLGIEVALVGVSEWTPTLAPLCIITLKQHTSTRSQVLSPCRGGTTSR